MDAEPGVSSMLSELRVRGRHIFVVYRASDHARGKPRMIRTYCAARSRADTHISTNVGGPGIGHLRPSQDRVRAGDSKIGGHCGLCCDGNQKKRCESQACPKTQTSRMKHSRLVLLSSFEKEGISFLTWAEDGPVIHA